MNDPRVCLITGASRGLGAYLARRFWDQGYSLCLVASDCDRLQTSLSGLPVKKGQHAVALVCDLAQGDQVRQLIHRCADHVARMDVVINNAAILGPVGRFVDNNLDDWQKTLQVNMLAPITITQSYLSSGLSREGGVIINISGGGATSLRPNFSAYATAKTGLVRFSEIIAHEVKNRGIRVNCIAPGIMDTSMLQEIMVSGEELAGQREYANCVRVLQEGSPGMDKVGDLALFLTSPQSVGISGKIISAGHMQKCRLLLFIPE